MYNILDYLKWRCDLTFEAAPFNEVDNYIISKIGFLDFEDIVPEDSREVSLKDAIELYKEKAVDPNHKSVYLASPHIVPVTLSLPQYRRYADIRLSGFRSVINDRLTEQFSALTVRLPNGYNYVSFRGTDDTLIGWRENCNMAFTYPVQAQKDALAYLNWAASAYAGPIVVGGHSKGGNLAVFAASVAPQNVQNRIVKVYSNDGPGFKFNFFDMLGYQGIKDRVETIIPNYSLVGVLLKQPDNTVIVNTEHMGAASHDGYLWEVDCDHFVRADGLSKSSIAVKEAIDYMVTQMTPEEIEEFTNDVFGSLEFFGDENITELSEHKLRSYLKMVGSLGKDREMRRFLIKVFEQMILEYQAQNQAENNA